MARSLAVPELEHGVEEVAAVDRDVVEGGLERDHGRDAILPPRIERRVVEARAGVGRRDLRQGVERGARAGRTP
jgi:hypothetical protein